MPIECDQLKDVPIPLAACPACGAKPFSPFLRGQIQRAQVGFNLAQWFYARPWCALICESCHEVVGHESPYQFLI
jgi:hypothetical protein